MTGAWSRFRRRCRRGWRADARVIVRPRWPLRLERNDWRDPNGSTTRGGAAGTRASGRVSRSRLGLLRSISILRRRSLTRAGGDMCHEIERARVGLDGVYKDKWSVGVTALVGSATRSLDLRREGTIGGSRVQPSRHLQVARRQPPSRTRSARGPPPARPDRADGPAILGAGGSAFRRSSVATSFAFRGLTDSRGSAAATRVLLAVSRLVVGGRRAARGAS